jgi:hypothetical protein
MELRMASASVSLTEAATLTGKAKSTIYRDSKIGKISVSIGHDNTQRVDVSELIRVYGADSVKMPGSNVGNGSNEKIVFLEEKVEFLNEQISHLRNELVEARNERARLVDVFESFSRLLPQQQTETTPLNATSNNTGKKSGKNKKSKGKKHKRN